MGNYDVKKLSIPGRLPQTKLHLRTDICVIELLFLITTIKLILNPPQNSEKIAIIGMIVVATFLTHVIFLYNFFKQRSLLLSRSLLHIVGFIYMIVAYMNLDTIIIFALSSSIFLLGIPKKIYDKVESTEELLTP